MAQVTPTAFARQTVLAHPEQPLYPIGRMWSWGPDWQIGERRGRWAIGYLANTGQSRMVRVQWDGAVPLVDASEFTNSRLMSAVYCRTIDEQAKDRDAALQAIADFDAMAADLWEHRER
jgi:hypothetical protein